MIAVILGHLGIPELGHLYSFHLTVFFILSGYTFRQEPVSAKFLRNKLNRLMFPYFVSGAAMIVVRIANQMILQNDFYAGSFTDLLYIYIEKLFFASGGRTDILGMDAGPYSAIGATWFLPAMFFAAVIVQIILNIVSDKKAQMLVGIIIAALAAASNMIWLPASVQAGMFAVPFVLFGKLLRDNNIIEKIRWHHLLMLAAVFALGCYTEYAKVMYIVDATVRDWLFTVVCALASSMLVIGFSYKIRRLPGIEFIGRNSLIVLCVHNFEMNVFADHLLNLRALLGIPETDFTHGAFRLLFAVVVSAFVVLFNNREKAEKPVKSGARNISIDIMRALLIILMIIGHSRYKTIEMSDFIYSFHMMAFVMVSGYFFRSGAPLFTSVVKTLKMLIPYAAFGIVYILVNDMGWPSEIKNVIASVSSTKNYLTDIPTVGPVYFITMLYGVRLVYLFIDRCKNELAKHCIVLALVAVSVHLGAVGAWLPWSFDCALFCVAFYHIAHYMRKYDFLTKCKEHPYIYFPASCLWAFLIHKGGIELAVRNYGSNIGLTILGAVSAFIIMYLLSDSISNHMPRFFSRFLACIGRSTMYILIVHSLFDGRISGYITRFTALDPSHIGHMWLSILIQLMAGVIVYLAVELIKKLIRPRPAKNI